jgi:acetyl esterase/lipase
MSLKAGARTERMERRRALIAMGALALGACSRSRTSAPLPPGGAWQDLSFDPSPDAPDGERALVFAPAKDLPLLVALHGRGESGRGLEIGAHGWRDDYLIEHMHDRLRAPPLVAKDMHGMATPARLAAINAALEAAPYSGLCVTSPYTPDLPDRSPAGATGFGRFVVETLIPRARAAAGAKQDRAATGIDGVSMGGRLALFVGLAYPEVFGSVGALQPALRPEEAPMISELARASAAKAPLSLRLLSSEADPFLPAVRAVSERLRADGIVHELLVVVGNHDYDFNRGPGSAEMLVRHERILRGLRAP